MNDVVLSKGASCPTYHPFRYIARDSAGSGVKQMMIVLCLPILFSRVNDCKATPHPTRTYVLDHCAGAAWSNTLTA